MFDGAWPTILHRVVTEFDRWGVGCPHVPATCNRSGAVHGSDHVGWTSSSTGGLGSQGQCRPGFKAWAHDGSCKSGSPTQRGARKVGCNPHPSVVPAVPVFGSLFLFLWLYWMIGRWQIEIVWVGRRLWITMTMRRSRSYQSDSKLKKGPSLADTSRLLWYTYYFDWYNNHWILYGRFSH